MMIAGIIIGVVIAFAVGLSYALYRLTFYHNPKKRSKAPGFPKNPDYAKERELRQVMLPQLEALPHEEVGLLAFDGTKLAGRLIWTAEPGLPRFIVAAHGYHGSALPNLFAWGEIARKAGCNLLLPDQRAHGKSAGHTTSFGILESRDLAAWDHYLTERFGTETQIINAGVSLGGATVLLATEHDLPLNVKGIIEDCGFASPGEIIRRVGRDMHYPVKPLWPFLKLGARLYGHFRLSDYGAKDAIAKTELPLLVIHGDKDTYVPVQDAQLIFAAAGTEHKKIEIFEGAGHALSWLYGREEYEKAVCDFVAECLER